MIARWRMEEVIIEGYDHQGQGIARINNKVIFIPNTIKGEVAKIKIIQDKKKYAIGEVISLVKESPIRVKSQCPYFEKCGGCDFLHLHYSEQLRYKYDKVSNIIVKYTKLDIPIKDIVPSDKQFHYRNKVTFQEQGKQIGFFDKKSHNIIAIDACLLLDEKLNEYLKRDKVSSLVLRTNGKEVLDNDGTIIKIIGDMKFAVSLSSFFQVNDNVTYKMYEQIKKYANGSKKDNLLDLYCGTGTIGIYLSKTVGQALGIEINEKAIVDANKNKKLNNISNINFMASDVSNVIDKLDFKPSIIIVDPPRAGLDQKTIAAIIKMRPQKLIYTSCDPMTLARDLNCFKEDFNIIEITPFDMFPNTHHIECVCLLKIKEEV